MFNFSQLAWINSGRGQDPLAKGLLPPLKTILSLLIVAAGIAFCGWLWAGVLTAVTFGWSAAGVAGVALLNHLFARDIFTFAFATRNPMEGFDHSRNNSTSIVELVDHLRVELNICLKEKYGAAHKDIPPVRLLAFTEPSFKLFSVGPAPENAAILLSTGVFNYEQTGMDQRHLAALIEMELVKIYFRRGTASAITSVATNLLTTVEILTLSSAWPRFLGGLSHVLKILAGPLQFFMLLQLASERNHAYHAAEIVAVDCGRGRDLMKAYDKKVDPTLKHKPTPIELDEIRERFKRPPYNGANPGIKKWVDWIRDNEYPTDCKDEKVIWGSLAWSGMMILVRELGFFFYELFSKDPRSTNIGKHIRNLVKGNRPSIEEGSLGEEVTLNTIKTGEKWYIKQSDWERNKKLFDKMPAESRYLPISPEYNGKRDRGERTLIFEDGKIVGHSQIFTLYRCVAPHMKQREEMEVTNKPASLRTSSMPQIITEEEWKELEETRQAASTPDRLRERRKRNLI